MQSVGLSTVQKCAGVGRVAAIATALLPNLQNCGKPCGKDNMALCTIWGTQHVYIHALGVYVYGEWG